MLASKTMLASRPILSACQRRAFSATVRQVRSSNSPSPSTAPIVAAQSQHALDNTDGTCQASKVTVLGGAGGIGQPLSLLMKLNPRVTELALYDIKGGPGQPQMLQLRDKR